MRRNRRLLVAWFLLVFGLVGFFLGAIAPSFWQVVDSLFWPIAAGAMALALVAAFFIARTARTLRQQVGTFLGTVWVVGVLLAIIAHGLIVSTNAWLDPCSPTAHRVKVLGKERRRGFRNVIFVESWRDDGEVELYAPRAVYKASPTHVIVETCDGALGLTWVDSIRAD